MCAVALLSSPIAAVLMPDLLLAQTRLARFDWNYGQLLNFSGLHAHRVACMAAPGGVHLLVLFGSR